MKKFLIVDGSSLVHRAFYALPPLTNAAGVFTNAAYGFTTMFLRIMNEEKPDYVVVCFDKSRVTFRNGHYEAYKAHRKATPPELRPQFELVKRILAAMNIGCLEMEGYEGDDLIGTFAKQGEAAGLANSLLTGDKDALQLVSPATTVLMTRKGISDLERFDEAAVHERYGLVPAQITDLKGLMGDASDNIPGVPGIGEKTALKLLGQFQTVENLLANLEQVKPEKLQEKMRQYQEQAILSKKLATIECDVPLEERYADYQYREADLDQLLEVYRELEFKSLVKAVLEKMAASRNQHAGSAETASADAVGPTVYQNIADGQPDDDLPVLAKTAGVLAVLAHWQGNYFQGEIDGLSFALPAGRKFFADLGKTSARENLAGYQALISDPAIGKIVHNAKDNLVLFHQAGSEIAGISGDVMLEAYLLNPSAAEYTLESLCLEYLDQALLVQDDLGADQTARAGMILALDQLMAEKIAAQGMERLYREVELPLAEVLADMEILGIKVDAAQLKVMSGEMAAAIETLTGEIHALAGEAFNINSPKQLAVILFEKLGLPPLKKTKTGYSTNAEVLEQLAEQHDIAAKIVEHRTLAKLKSTYVDGMQGLINPRTGRLHTSFNQTVAATGRLSSTEPNLQNIPIRMEIGRLIRKAFVPGQPENMLVAGDYSQIELRVLAHISGDPVLQEAFRQEQDIHARTAAEVFGVAMDQVTPELRRRAKAVNFGIVYGISDYGLSRDLGISRQEAKKYIDAYFARYPGVADYLQRIVAEARENGYVTTLLNRRRYLPDVYSSNFNIRSFGERTAMNTPIQGSAADIIKVAMVNIHRAFRAKGFKSAMLLQVHDELIFDVVPGELNEVTALVQEMMENAVILDVPLLVDMKMGADWYAMKKLTK